MQAPADADMFEDLNLMEVWRILAARRVLIMVTVVVVTIGAVAASYLIRPVFRADALLAGATEEGMQSSLGSLLGQYRGLASLAGADIDSPQGNSVDETIEILRSRAFTDKFITSQKLIPVLLADVPEQPASAVKGADPAMWAAYKRFNEMRKIARDAETGFFKVSIEWHDPAAAAAWVNALVEMLNEHLRQRAIEEASRSILYLQDQLDKTPVVERRQMLVGIMESETRKIVLAKAREEYAVRVLDHAVVPQEKVKPRRLVIAAAAVLAGVILGVGLALILTWRERAARQA